MSDDSYRNLPFAPWATDVGWQKDQAERLAVLAEMVANCRDRHPTDAEREAIAWFAARGRKLPGYCRQLAAALGRIRRELGVE
jgi:hypothetical protein